MYFRLVCWVNRFRLFGDVSFPVGGEHKLTVRLRRPTGDEVEQQTDIVPRESAVCIATGVWDLSPGLRVRFEQRAETAIVVDEALPSPEAVTTFAWFAVEEQREINVVRSAMLDTMNRVVDLIRWYLGFRIPHNPLFYRWLEWSLDGQSWGGLTEPWVWRSTGDLPTSLEGKPHAEIMRLLGEGGIDALPRSLWQEAWDQQRTNPRSAVIVAIAAAEVGVKHAIGRLAPDAAWLVRQPGFPPMVEVLRGYLPSLLAQKLGTDVSAPPEDTVITPLATGVETRNTLVHRLPGDPRYEDAKKHLDFFAVEQLLWAVSDLLWILSSYSGNERVLDRLRTETEAALDTATRRDEAIRTLQPGQTVELSLAEGETVQKGQARLKRIAGRRGKRLLIQHRGSVLTVSLAPTADDGQPPT